MCTMLDVLLSVHSITSWCCPWEGLPSGPGRFFGAGRARGPPPLGNRGCSSSLSWGQDDVVDCDATAVYTLRAKKLTCDAVRCGSAIHTQDAMHAAPLTEEESPADAGGETAGEHAGANIAFCAFPQGLLPFLGRFMVFRLHQGLLILPHQAWGAADGKEA